ncbi:hypothetical protein [Leyella stercorea]
MQTSATVDADIRNGRRRHPQRSTRMLYSTPKHKSSGKVDIPSTLPLSLK